MSSLKERVEEKIRDLEDIVSNGLYKKSSELTLKDHLEIMAEELRDLLE